MNDQLKEDLISYYLNVDFRNIDSGDYIYCKGIIGEFCDNFQLCNGECPFFSIKLKFFENKYRKYHGLSEL